MKRRLLALLLVLAMLLPMIPMGTMAEDWEEPSEGGITGVTARMTEDGGDGVEVFATGSPMPATVEDPLYVVAAAFDSSTGRMIDSAYKEYTSPNYSGEYSFHLYKTPEDASIYVYVLKGDLQPYTTERVQADWIYRGYYGEDISWSFEDGNLFIDGAHYDPDGDTYYPTEMPEGNYPWSRFAYQTKFLRVSGVAVIAPNAFRDFTELESISLDEDVTAIGEAAFYGVEKAEVNVWGDFDWDNLVLFPGNDIIEKARPAVDEPVEEIPALNEQEATEPTQATEETVQETTEEPAAEEKSAEAPKDETVQEPEEGLTSEEAAQEGYYVAPEGAQLQEGAELEELAAFTGTDKTASKGQHIANFTGLAPYKAYTFLVSANPGSLDGLKYISFAYSDSEGDAAVAYVPKDESKAIVQLYGPEKLTLTVEQDYITLQPGEKAQIRLISNGKPEIYPDYDQDVLNVAPDGEDTTLYTVSIKDDFQEKLTDVQTRYVTFSAYEDSQDASTMVRVDLVPGDSQIKDATLGETTVTHNYYSTEATAIPVFLGIEVPKPEEEPTVDTFAAFDAAEEEKTDFIQAVTFSEDTPQDVQKAFEIQVQDDHTLLLSTKLPEKTAEYADGQPIDLSPIVNRLKSSYNVGFLLTIKGQEEQLPVTGTLKLNVQKKLPTLKAATVNLNTYAQPTGIVTITGGEVEKIENVTGSDGVMLTYNEENNTIIAWLKSDNYKSGTVNLTAQAWVKGYNQPVSLKVPVKNDAKVPSMKLGKTSLNTVSIVDLDEEIPILCTAKGVSVENMNMYIDEIKDSRGNDLSSCYEAEIENGKLYLKSSAGTRPVGKQNLVLNGWISVGYRVHEYNNLMNPVSFKLTVNNVEPIVKLNKSSLLLNVGVIAGVPFKATVTGIPEDVAYTIDHFIQGDSYLTDAEKAGEYFDWNWDGADGLTLKPDFFKINDSRDPDSPNYDPDFDFDAFLNDTYTLYVGVKSPEDADEEWALDQDKWAKVRVTLTEDMPEITSLKVSGVIDLNNDDSRVTFTPTYSGKQSIADAVVEVTGEDEFFPFPISYNFDKYMDGEKVLIGRAAGEDFLKPGTYTATFRVFWGLGTVEKTTTIKVVEKKPTLKVTGKLDSGKEGSALYVTSSYKHSIGDGLMQTPEVALLSGGVPVDENLYNVEFEESGRIKITPNVFGEELLKAGKYTLQLTFGDKELVQTANITVSQTTPTLKISKTSVTLHPEFDTREAENENAVFIFNSYTGVSHDAKYEFYQANGKTEWDDQPYVRVEEFSANGYIVLGPTGKAPDKDTTVKIKVTPDSRIPNKFGWITVKVLGGKSLTKKLTLKASNALDPSCSYTDAMFTTKVSGFDNKNIQGEVVLQQYVSGKWQDVENGSEEEPWNQFYNGWAYGDNAYISMHDVYEEGERTQYLDPNGKYRMVVTYSDHVSATVDLKVAYGKNKFTAQAPILYKQDYKAGVSFYIDQQNADQQIAKVTIKNQAKTGFTLESNDRTLYGKNDWTLQYTGDLAKLKTTTLTLQIFLKGNETTKPNATMSLKVTVK